MIVVKVTTEYTLECASIADREAFNLPDGTMELLDSSDMRIAWINDLNEVAPILADLHEGEDVSVTFDD